MKEFISLYLASNRKETWSEYNPDGRWRKFSVNEIISREKINLDIFWLKDENYIDLNNLPEPEEIIDSYINRQHDLDKLNMGFVLLTDGLCWDNKSKNQLQKGFRNMNYLMNFYLAKNGMLEEVIQTYFK